MFNFWTLLELSQEEVDQMEEIPFPVFMVIIESTPPEPQATKTLPPLSQMPQLPPPPQMPQFTPQLPELIHVRQIQLATTNKQVTLKRTSPNTEWCEVSSTSPPTAPLPTAMMYKWHSTEEEGGATTQLLHAVQWPWNINQGTLFYTYLMFTTSIKISL